MQTDQTAPRPSGTDLAQNRRVWGVFVASALLAGGLAGYQLYMGESTTGGAAMILTALLWPLLTRQAMTWAAHVAFLIMATGTTVGLLLTGALLPALLALVAALTAWHFSGLLQTVTSARAPDIGSIVASDLLWLAAIGVISASLVAGVRRLSLDLPFLGGLTLGILLLAATALLIRAAFTPLKREQDDTP